MRLKNVFQQSSNQTSICKNCFKEIDNFNLYSLKNKQPCLCKRCINQFQPHFEKFKIDSIQALTLFYYDVFMKDLIYKFKGCYDYELKSVFLELYKRELSILYHGYEMIPAPSYIEDDNRRGFNHVIEIFKSLNLKMNEVFVKTEKFKQADNNFHNRKKIKKYIKIKDNAVFGKKILLVDDIYTTGNTMRTMISLLKERGITDIKVLVLCKTILQEKEGDNLMQ